MSDDPQQPNVQAGVPLTPGHDPASESVATGDRRSEVHYEPDADQLVAAKFLHHPEGPLPQQEQSQAGDREETKPQPHIGDVAVASDSPSVWDARPTADDVSDGGNSPAH